MNLSNSISFFTRSAFITLTALGVVFASSTANCALIPTGPFVGGSSESFESMPYGSFWGPASVLDGVGMLSGTTATSYPLYLWGSIGGLSLGGGVTAVPYDGIKGVVNNGSAPVARIDFTAPVSKFGGYWGSAFNSNISFTFYDETDTVIDTDTVTYSMTGPSAGILEWFGWKKEPTDPYIAAVEWTGNWATADGLQVDAVGVPAPGAATLMCLAGLGLLCRTARQENR